MSFGCVGRESWEIQSDSSVMRGLFITGTDTGVGKTMVAATIIRTLRESGHRVGAYKPVCSGAEVGEDGAPVWTDIQALAAALGDDVPLEKICPQRFAAPLAPPAAAALEGRRVDEPGLSAGVDSWRASAEILVVEGVGGLLCPLSDASTVADFAGRLGFPLVIVAALRLGAINQTLLTIEVARGRKLPIAGVLLNQVDPDDGASESSISQITALSEVPILGVVPRLETAELRGPHVLRRIDWADLASSVS